MLYYPKDLQKQDYSVIAVVGDGALTAGMSFEALNHLGDIGGDVGGCGLNCSPWNFWNGQKVDFLRFSILSEIKGENVQTK